MLTTDLVRVRVSKGVLRPQYIDVERPGLIERAEALCALFEGHEAQTRGELDEAVADVVGDAADFAVTRGLAKLLDDRSEWDTVSPIDPVELRRRVFESAMEHHPVGLQRSAAHPVCRADVIAEVAAELGTSADAVESALYADLKSEQRMTRHRRLPPKALLDRYNVALAQGVLIRAHELRIDVAVDRPSKLRGLFRALKFHQLMHRTERVSRSRWRITIDGPASLFEQSQRYGVAMARFLPHVLLLPEFSVEADVDWHGDGQKRPFRLDASDGLRSHLKARGTWISDEEKAIYDRINKAKSPWRARRDAVVVDLDGRDVLVPDFVVKCEETGRRAFVEIVGFWRRGWLERRAELLAEHGPSNLVLCVSRRLATEKAALDDRFDVIDFAKVIPLKAFVERIEAVAE